MDSKNKFSPTVLKIVKFRDKCQNFDHVGDPLKHNIPIDITIVKLRHNYGTNWQLLHTIGNEWIQKTFNSTFWKIVKFCDKCQNFDVVGDPPRHNISIDITIFELQHTCGTKWQLHYTIGNKWIKKHSTQHFGKL